MAYRYAVEVLKDQLRKCIEARDAAEKSIGEGWSGSDYSKFTTNTYRIEQLQKAIKELTNGSENAND